MLFEVWCNAIILPFLDLVPNLNTKTHLDIIIDDFKLNILNLTLVQYKWVSISFFKIQFFLGNYVYCLNKQIDHRKTQNFVGNYVYCFKQTNWS
jgi:hypothetical protein